MSGGYFDFRESVLLEMAEVCASYIYHNGSKETDEWGCRAWPNFGEETISVLKDIENCLRTAYVGAVRVDYLISGDDCEESFMRRLVEDVSNIKDKYNEQS